MLRDPSPRRGSRADPARARHHHVERLQRLGRAVPVHRWDTRLVRATVRGGVPGETGAGRTDDADRARPRGDGVPELGAAARPVGLERRRRLVELGAAVPALGGVERLPDRRRDLTRPRDAPRDPGRAPSDPPRGPRRVLVVGYARRAGRARRRRRERRDLQRQHLLLADPVRGLRPRDDVLQVPRRRGRSGARDLGRTVPLGDLVRSARRPAGNVDDRADVHARRLLAVRAGRPARVGGLHRGASRSLGVRGHRPPRRRHVRRAGHDRRVRGRRLRVHPARGASRPDA